MKKFTTHNKKIGKNITYRVQRWSIKIHNSISKATELLNRLLAKGYSLLEDLKFSKGFYSFVIEYKTKVSC